MTKVSYNNDMAKRIYCTNCGAPVGEFAEKCPYCGALNPTGAEAAYMEKLRGIRSEMAEMDDDLEETYVRELKKRGSRFGKIAAGIAIVIVAFILLISVNEMIFRVRAKRDSEREIAFQKEYFEELDRVYGQGDDASTLDYIQSLYGKDGASALWTWKHMDYFEFYGDYSDMKAVRDALAKLEGGAGKELSAREREGYEGDIAWVVYRILQTRRDEYRGLSQAKVTEEERQKVLGYFEEEDVFLTDVLGLDEAAQDEIWKQSLTREGGYADYDKLKKALAPHLAKWFE